MGGPARGQEVVTASVTATAAAFATTLATALATAFATAFATDSHDVRRDVHNVYTQLSEENEYLALFLAEDSKPEDNVVDAR